MGAADVLARRYMADPARFADAFNYVIYGGEQVIRANELQSLDTVAVVGKGRSSEVPSERRRDGLMTWGAMRDGHMDYIILGMEEQTNVDRAMPVRCMLYDAMGYMGQVDQLKKENRRSGTLDTDEWISGLRKTDTLMPTVTLVLYLGSDKWDGPLRVHDMFASADSKAVSLIPDYQMNLMSPAAMDDEELIRFKTDLGLVLGYIKYQEDKDELGRFVMGDERFQSVERDAVDLVNALTDSRLEYDPGEERVNMCQAIKDMRAESYESGRAYERQHMCQAIKDMRAESMREGRREGVQQGILQTLADLVSDGVLSPADAAARAGLTPEEFQDKVAEL